ncbi:MAG: dTDP-4-dehydrorhamnose 3,5-epimerase family protein [Actinobacteria bacterium]|nr:dTDP-4-dehydrorhamnose 3,5-epimerase family protein [Actinomycetota bacterium]MBU4239955.1 dTDP-4-dehydrorhamnose 3,5-epimerase family protein [Actinomycetota bacterium]MBU4386398.1 dTDP-4-dehydrorhamnose 3,5-epimerase family protein [Actinomycetota bacterium]MBU4490551.1 dTDP-4-dehydrorhamnose 3,5-epimerase family protein [Actinomycetota bacterium]MCG2796667.1 dTDP-4-dehydrorhamnose 3,5-epimerase family protein [Actinomycetes bacterium]
MIEGVVIKQLRVIPDERGHLMEMLRSDDEVFEKFGQAYMTTTYPGVVKAWHMHKKQNDNVVCVRGMIKLGLYDGRKGSGTEGEVMEIFLGENRPVLVHIPREVHHGWKCVSEEEAYVVNVPTELYDYDNPDEHRLPFDTDEIPYDWDIKMG